MRRPRVRISVLSGLAGRVLDTHTGDSGIVLECVVTDDRERIVRRTLDATLVDTPVPRVVGDPFHPGSHVRVEVDEDGSGWRILGSFVVTSAAAAMTARLTIHGEDPLHLSSQPFGDTLTIVSGTPAAEALRIAWSPVLGDPAEWDLDDDGRAVPLRVFLPDEDRLDAVVRLMEAQGLEVFADRAGRPRLRPVPDPTTAGATASVRAFRPGPDAAIVEMVRSAARRPVNRVIVESTSPTGAPIRVVRDVTDESSPLHASRIGVQAAPVHRSAQMLDAGAAARVADALLIEHGLATDEVSGSALPDPSLDAGDVVDIEEPTTGTTGRYRLTRLVHPATTGLLSITASRVVPLLARPAPPVRPRPTPIVVEPHGELEGEADFGLVEVGA